MTLTLTIENVATLPDGGPLSVTLSGRRGLDIGRDQYLDWTLPDPDRTISGKHAEIRHRDGAYWLQDVSRNGTFLNRNPQRVQEACRLSDGDRIQIGPYIIAVRIEGAAAPPAASPSAPMPVPPQDYWDMPGEAAPPIHSRGLAPPAAPVRPDFINWAVDLPVDIVPPRAPAGDDMDWARASPPPPAPPPPRMPDPRRRAPEPSAPPAEGPASRPAPDPFAPDPNGWPDTAREMARDPDPRRDPGGAYPDRSRDRPGTHPEAPPRADREPGPPRPAPDRGRRDEAGPSAAQEAFVARFAAGLGIPPEILAWQDPGDLAEEAGLLLRLCADNLKQLLAARTESKRAVKAASHTVIQALDNNPLKFAPTTDDALRIMLGRPSSAYLEARRAMDTGFRDLKTHQVKTYAAMQNALRLLMEDLSPEGIEASDEKDRGLTGLLGSRKARLWDIYTTRWDALASPHDDAMVDAFMLLFADCYDKGR
ncbi:type VI secretion system-associated FHA domain protein TagH [Methylobacterium sp. NEAU 140]|uniref:type VI secretion system-associated FHA domain protein TagH n=1 Tax=Methylobacterium sp. NEAU 140 TaxID=3064945 RepID=UPI00273230F3|nr:type VI secretion system-associated FHA domain protein TagH [Methylobacterium sp. NEAU 140]MDP4024941.1 type VI secretion system-associated FHA domain protein TagH [Methylobacterium sp. NEAU 140]